MKTNQLKITYQKTGDLVPYARNSRTHSEEQVAQIASSIREFGFTNPVLVDEQNTIIAGHGRIMAAQKLGLGEVPTITLAGLTEAQRKAYIIADNRLALNAGWDTEILRLELLDLQEEGFGADITGWSDAEITSLITGGSIEAPEDFPEASEDIETEHQCPRCQYKWSGKSK
jgi:ParB-like chromosome segregation protein Spo0J